MPCDLCADHDFDVVHCPACAVERQPMPHVEIQDEVTEVALGVVSGQIDHIDQVSDELSHLPNWAKDLVVSEIRGKFPHLTE